MHMNTVCSSCTRMQASVHGLLGQNAINPPPERFALPECMLPWALPSSGAGAVQLDGACSERVCSQGEGFIDGSYDDYQV